MSKIPKLPKGQSRPASPEPSPKSLNDNNTPNMQVLQPRSSSLSRSSSLRRSFIRPPKSKVSCPSAIPPQKSGSPPPPAAVGPSTAKGLPPSGLPTSVVTTPKTGLPPTGIPSATVPSSTCLPPSGLPTLGGVSKGDSPNTKLVSPNLYDSDSKLSSPRKSSFSRNSPLRTSRIPRKPSLPQQPPQQTNTSTEPALERADSVSSDQSEDRTGNFSSPNDSRNSSPTPSNISKIPTVRGSGIPAPSRHSEILKSRRLKYPALWTLGAPNFFSENYDMSGNTSLELLRLGVEELETRVSSLESQMGIQNTELLYNSDDDDSSPQDPEEAYLHELTDPMRTSTTSLTSMLGSYSYLKPPLHTSPSTSTSNLMKSPTTSMSNLRSPTSSLTNLRSPSTSLSNLRSPLGSMSNLRSPSTSMVSLLKRPESPCRSPDKSYNCNDTTYKSNDRGVKPLSFQRFLSPWADYSEQIDRILNFRKVH